MSMVSVGRGKRVCKVLDRTNCKLFSFEDAAVRAPTRRPSGPATVRSKGQRQR